MSREEQFNMLLATFYETVNDPGYAADRRAHRKSADLYEMLKYQARQLEAETGNPWTIPQPTTHMLFLKTEKKQWPGSPPVPPPPSLPSGERHNLNDDVSEEDIEALVPVEIGDVDATVMDILEDIEKAERDEAPHSFGERDDILWEAPEPEPEPAPPPRPRVF